jgi:hypothetical protein
LITLPLNVAAGGSVCGDTVDLGGIDSVCASGARSALSAGAAVAEQPSVAAGPARTAGAGGGASRAVAARPAAAEQPAVATVAPGAAVDAGHAVTAASAVAEQQAGVAAALSRRPLRAIADQQPSVRMIGGAVADERPEQGADRIDGSRAAQRSCGQPGPEQSAARQLTTCAVHRRRLRWLYQH